MSADSAQGHREGGRGTSAQGCSSPWVAMDLVDYFFTGPQIPEGPADFNNVPAKGRQPHLTLKA
eukprot:10109718-Alexandrium_andersonii.AAC.1